MTVVCKIEDIPEQAARGFEIEGQKILVAKKKGNIYVYRNSCPHTGINLEWQPDDFMSFDKAFLQCSVHGAQFQVEDGYCVLGPCQGQHLTAIPFELIEGKIILNN